MESPKQIKELGRFVKKIHFLSFPIPVKPGMYIRLQGVPKISVLSSFHPYMAFFATRFAQKTVRDAQKNVRLNPLKIFNSMKSAS